MIERVVICLDNILGYLRCITTVVARDWNQCGDKNVCAVTRSTALHVHVMSMGNEKMLPVYGAFIVLQREITV